MDRLQKEELIKREIQELTELLSNIEEDIKPFANRLIQQCAFMQVTLRELQETLNEDGSVELYTNGKQNMLKEHPASKTYNTMIKNYNSLIKQLIDMVPETTAEEKDELLDFLGNGKK